jgi:hypothetical protein
LVLVRRPSSTTAGVPSRCLSSSRTCFGLVYEVMLLCYDVFYPFSASVSIAVLTTASRCRGRSTDKTLAIGLFRSRAIRHTVDSWQGSFSIVFWELGVWWRKVAIIRSYRLCDLIEYFPIVFLMYVKGGHRY